MEGVGRGSGMVESKELASYYFSFTPTGCGPVDDILAAVALAGRVSHHTNGWCDPCPMSFIRGNTPEAWIQNAANRAAKVLGGGA